MTAGITNFGSSIIGNLPKAILCVRKSSPAAANTSQLHRINVASETAQAATNAAAKAASQLEMATELAKSGNNRINSFKDIQNISQDSFHIMQVQYNPTSLNMHSQAGSFQTKQGAGESGINQITQMTLPPQTSLSFDLVFDAMNMVDAFMNEKLVNSIGSAGAAITSLAKKKYSVQIPVDGLIALITQEATRQVIFHWTDMTFFGELESVNARYTMFNPKGNPIRAVVSLTIRQRLSSGNNAQAAEDHDYWQKAFTKLFGENGDNNVIDSKSGLDKFSNLINLNL